MVRSMAQRRRRRSQNGRLMRKILLLLREYDVDEIEILCSKYEERLSPSRRRRTTRRVRRREA